MRRDAATGERVIAHYGAITPLLSADLTIMPFHDKSRSYTLNVLSRVLERLTA